MVAEPEKAAKHHRFWKWFWIANFPVLTALYIFMIPEPTAPENLFLLYISYISLYANVESAASTEQAAESRRSE